MHVRPFVDTVRSIPLLQGANPTPIPFLTIYRFTTPTVTMPDIQKPYWVINGMIWQHTPLSA